MRQSLCKEDTLVIIDEVQKLPVLLDEVQAVLLKRLDVRFVLTGSSARKLKRGGAILAGRALVQRVHPLCFTEMTDTITDFELLNYLQTDRGGPPPVLDSPFLREDLASYVGTYLQEEILAEGLSRGVQSFAYFLEAVATTNAEQINLLSSQ
jgi:uncharacterized protein